MTTAQKLGLGCVGLMVACGLFPGASWAAEHELGVGLHHWEALDNLDLDEVAIDESGTSALLVYRVNPQGLFAFEFDLEYFADGFAGATDEALSPQLFVLLGKTLYGGVGVGVTVADDLPGGDEVSDPFYAARLGVAFPLLPRLRVDLNGNYQSGTFDDLDRADSDTITVGAHLRLRIK